jgi:hypothetical protein
MNQRVATKLRLKALNIWEAMPRTDKSVKMTAKRVYKLVKKDFYGFKTYGCGCKREEKKKLCPKHGRT